MFTGGAGVLPVGYDSEVRAPRGRSGDRSDQSQVCLRGGWSVFHILEV